VNAIAIPSWMKRKIMEVFVTSDVDPVYAIKANVDPQVFGAFGSYFSRNPKDFRVHLWNAITGQVEEQQTDVDQDDLKWILDSELNAPYQAIKKGLKTSQDFFKKWYGKYSHKSIANEVWIPMVATNVSQLWAREIAYEQLAFFIEQSTRYVRWDLNKMYKDIDIMESPARNIFLNSLQTSIEGYDQLTDVFIGYFTSRNPIDEWLVKQDESIKRAPQNVQLATYKRQIQGAALDRSRFLLPQATQTNIAWICDARSTEFDIAAWKGHPLHEIKFLTEFMEKAAGSIAPSLLKYTGMNDYYADNLHNYNFDLAAEPPVPFEKGVDLISFESQSLEKTVANILLRHNKGGTFSQRFEQVMRMSFEDKMDVLHRVVKNRGPHDEKVEVDETFNMAKLAYEVRTDIGATRDWRRHQKWDRNEPLYTLDNGYYRPDIIDELPQEAQQSFDGVFQVAHKAEKAITEAGLPYQAQYVIPMGTRHPIVFAGGLDDFQYKVGLRTTPQANFSYRIDAFNIAEAVVRQAPWLLGYETYPGGKSFMQIYDEAPLKGIVRLQTGEAEFHN